jgi:hypothetical protein
MDAIVFERAWSTAPWTLPSRASMITGKYPTLHGAHYARETGEATISEVLPFVPRHNFRANRLPESHETLAEVLAAEGYATAAFVGGRWLATAFGLPEGVEGRISGSGSRVVAESRSSDCHVRKLGSEADRDLRALIEWPWKLVVSSRGGGAPLPTRRGSAGAASPRAGLPIERDAARTQTDHRALPAASFRHRAIRHAQRDRSESPSPRIYRVTPS